MEHDVIVVGGGLVGASFARAARGRRIALIESGQRAMGADVADPDVFDGRVYALSPGSVAFLEQINVWQAIPDARKTPVRAMRVYGDDGAARLDFDAYDIGVPELAWIVEDRELQNAMWHVLGTQDDFKHYPGAVCAGLDVDAEGARLELSDGRRISARLIIGADGAHSFVRSAAGIDASERSYGQTAVVANFSCSRAHGSVAFQWFQGGPVLALLPLPGNRASMVWSVADERAEQLMAAAPQQLARELEEASGGVLGTLEVITPPQAFSLRCVVAARAVAPRIALIGDAAHVIHPLAGQGANLGFQDARALAAVLAAVAPLRDPGDLRLLRRYERSRREAVLAMRSTVNGLFELFSAQSLPLHRLRNFGLNLTGRLPVLRNVLARQALA